MLTNSKLFVLILFFPVLSFLASCDQDYNRQVKIEATSHGLLFNGDSILESDVVGKLNGRYSFPGIETIDVYGDGTISRDLVNDIEKFAKKHPISYALHISSGNILD